ncbi:DUF2950 domain-containing protein [Accumulibacter sp.]|uniref:DUF2950 domain-containing protein n=1 Tax=Accumulibacter sp. TaxID=2053492 RepID=UPI0025E886EA|nr:DUF2950 domain-containing protein [Accumulibacter sp.]MCM8596721.1 DUF2950 domain-containing protein [Accumulibacter sp.]MCM8624745.1 DUF2950 domain-containing protein [Accumulibacter sp.]MDS4050870.1 DUF2950 domain-containing protein [Accumulibacter sp.]
MNCKFLIGTLAAALLVSAVPTVAAASPAAAARTVAQPGYATPGDAAQALAEAVRAEDLKALVGVLGTASRSWLSSGDPVIDRRDWERFLAAYDRKHTISEVSDGRAILLVGDDGWPFPAPLVRNGERWRFDSAAGKDEILNRRIGRNELDTIQTLLAVVDAQREYAAGDLDGNGSYDYARRFISSTGQRDGLYWPVAEGERPSPLGPLVGAAAREGYAARAAGNEPAAYHGYRYRILTAQGKDAPGGAYDYLVGDRLIGGFAVLAYPARYGVSGVMSFIVSHDGTIYQKNLGPASEAVARRMTRFNPDASWRKLD